MIAARTDLRERVMPMRILAALVALVLDRGAVARAELSEQAGARGGRLRGRRPDRRHRAASWRRSFPKRSASSSMSRTSAAPAATPRPGRSRARRADGYTIHGDLDRLHGEPEPLRQGAVRSDQGLRAGHAGRGLAQRRGGQSVGAGEDDPGAGAAHPGQSRQVFVRRPGVGSTPHLSGELFRLAFNLDLVHVPFTGAGPAIQATSAATRRSPSRRCRPRSRR